MNDFSSKIKNVEISEEAQLPTKYGDFEIRSFKENRKDGKTLEHLAIKKGTLKDGAVVRIHSECLTGDALHSLKCDCGEELALALTKIQKEGGLVIYLRQEGRGIGLFNKVNAYALQDQGLDTVEANLKLGFKDDERDYEVIKAVLDFYNLKSITLLTNNPKKIDSIKPYVAVNRSEILTSTNKYNSDYLKVKKDKMGHLL